MINIVIKNAQINIGAGPQGIKVLQAIDPQSGITVDIPLTAEGARAVGLQLLSSLVIANGALNNPRQPN